ncbi:hypothetical protein ACRQ3B_31435, partial [Citrobacter freundii]|uniref:hypothetical protein n=1 Tax=Citrobacter freundii TaxID=546 RepID=UPI003EEC9DEF
PAPRLRKSRPVRRKRRTARSPELKGLNETTSWLSAGYGLAGRRDGLVEPVNSVTGCAGLRRH